MKKLAGKVVVVTGASKGIGGSIAEHLAAEGASVVVNHASGKAKKVAAVASVPAIFRMSQTGSEVGDP